MSRPKLNLKVYKKYNNVYFFYTGDSAIISKDDKDISLRIIDVNFSKKKISGVDVSDLKTFYTVGLENIKDFKKGSVQDMLKYGEYTMFANTNDMNVDKYEKTMNTLFS